MAELPSLPRSSAGLVALVLSGAACAGPMQLPPSSGDLRIQALPEENEGARHFDRFVTVFGVYLFASEKVPDSKLLHASRVMADYLDNDRDGEPDDPMVVESMTDARAAMVMFKSPREALWSGIYSSRVLDELATQDLYARETRPEGEFDASLEEVLHLISDRGWAVAYPEAFNPRESELTNAMDLARGGRFEEIPREYPEEAWYHYDDRTCDYSCMSTEYFYWALTSILGAQSERCSDIDNEWELCTAELVEAKDSAVWELMRGGEYLLPKKLPDGGYPVPD